MSKKINKYYGVDGLQLIFSQYVKENSTIDYDDVYQYFEFYDENNNPIINPVFNENIWNLKRYRVTKESRIYYNFISINDLPDNINKYKQILIVNPNKQDLIVKVNYLKVSLVLDTTKLNGFTDGEMVLTIK